MFLARSASFLDRSKPSSALTVSEVSGTACTRYSASEPSSSGLRGVADLRQVALGELVGVGDDVGAARQVAEVGLERGRVHRDEHVGRVAGGEDVVVGEVQLEARHARQGACGGADLGGEVGQRRQVVAERRRLLR